MRIRGLIAVSMLFPVLTGCLSHTRKLQKVTIPTVVQTSNATELVTRLNRQYAAINSLTATVDFQASVGGARKGKVTDYTSFRGYILLRKPEMLRVLGLVPVIHTTAFDLASNGTNFKLLIPSQHKVVEGQNKSEKSAGKGLTSLRPHIFVDSMLIRGIAPDEQVMLTTDTNTIQDPQTKRWFEEQDYLLSVVAAKPETDGPNSIRELVPRRVIRFDRSTLLPVEQDIYDNNGAIDTQAIYGPEQLFGTTRYPGTITIKRPQEEYQIVVTVEKLVLNQKLADDQFEMKIPEGTQVQKLE